MALIDEEFFKTLEKRLNESVEWPAVYMFKFIVPAENRKIAMVEALFSPETEITTKESRGGKYISITGKVVMLSAIEVIKKYRKAAEIEGLIAL